MVNKMGNGGGLCDGWRMGACIGTWLSCGSYTCSCKFHDANKRRHI